MPGWKEGWGRPPRMLVASNQLLNLGRVLRLVCIINLTGSLATKDNCIPFIMLTLVSITVKSSTTYSQQNRWRSNYSLFINCWHAAGRQSIVTLSFHSFSCFGFLSRHCYWKLSQTGCRTRGHFSCLEFYPSSAVGLYKTPTAPYFYILG